MKSNIRHMASGVILGLVNWILNPSHVQEK